LKVIMGDDKTPNWGATSVEVLKERVNLYVDQEKYGEGFRLAAALVKKLAEPASKGGLARGHYLDSYYLQILCMYKYGKAKNNPKSVSDAGILLVSLEKEYADFGGEPWKTRFGDLLKAEPDLKTAYDNAKK
jgi:hypothetical protein